jgi:hypothetical protein
MLKVQDDLRECFLLLTKDCDGAGVNCLLLRNADAATIADTTSMDFSPTLLPLK